MKRFGIIALSLSLSSFCSSAEAESNSRQDANSTFNTEIFSLSKKKENAFDAPSATYVLSSEDIRRSGATSIPEALRMVPGLQVARMDGNKWAITARGFNRQFANKLLVMIDGRTVYTTLFSGTVWDIQDYVLEDVDRIEVVKGPGGTIWGANAVNGIINIITKSAVQTQGTYVSQIVGDQDKSITEARYGGQTASKDAYRFYVKKAVRAGLDRADGLGSNNDGIKQDRAGFRYDISSIKDNSITIHGDAFSGVAQNYFSTLKNPTKNDKDSKGMNLVVNWNKKLSNKSNFILNSYLDYDQFSLPILKRAARTFDVDFQHFYNFSKENQFIWGVGYRQIMDHINESDVNGNLPLHYSSSSRNDQWFSGFIQDKIGLVPDKLYLTLGTKIEKNDFTGFEYQPNARLSYYPARNQTIWAAVSRSVRTPTRGESDVTIRTGSSSTIVSQGSPSYGIEQLIAYEAGYRIKPTSKTLFDASVFYNDYSKLRTLESNNAGGVTPVLNNLGSAESYGFELTGKWQAMDNWKLEVNYDHLNLFTHVSSASTDDTTQVLRNSDSLSNAEGQSPRDQVKLKSFYNITPKIEFDNILYYVGGLNKGITNTGAGIPSYITWDTRLGYLMTRNLDLSIGIRDLMNQTHSEFKAALYNRQTVVGRTYYFKMVWQY
jgi:iron complex outermembrane recepter protein